MTNTSIKLEWRINHDHWEASTPFGRYAVGDAGSGKSHVSYPDKFGQVTEPGVDGKALCQADFARRCRGHSLR